MRSARWDEAEDVADVTEEESSPDVDGIRRRRVPWQAKLVCDEMTEA